MRRVPQELRSAPDGAKSSRRGSERPLALACGDRADGAADSERQRLFCPRIGGRGRHSVPRCKQLRAVLEHFRVLVRVMGTLGWEDSATLKGWVTRSSAMAKHARSAMGGFANDPIEPGLNRSWASSGSTGPPLARTARPGARGLPDQRRQPSSPRSKSKRTRAQPSAIAPSTPSISGG